MELSYTGSLDQSTRASEHVIVQIGSVLKALSHYIVCAVTEHRLGGPGFPYSLRAP